MWGVGALCIRSVESARRVEGAGAFQKDQCRYLIEQHKQLELVGAFRY